MIYGKQNRFKNNTSIPPARAWFFEITFNTRVYVCVCIRVCVCVCMCACVCVRP